jgi:hypothetical protein
MRSPRTSRFRRVTRFTALVGSVAITVPTVIVVATAPVAVATPSGNQTNSSDVGIWYSPLYDATGSSAWVWNNGRGPYTPSGGNPILYKPSLPDGSYGQYASDDTAVIDFYLSKIAEAKIDFLLLDETNGGVVGYYGAGGSCTAGDASCDHRYTWDDAALTASRIKYWNDHNSWQLKYAIAIGAGFTACSGDAQSAPGYAYSDCKGYAIEQQAAYVDQNFYANSDYYSGSANPYYMLDGAPLLVVHDENKPTVSLDAWGGSAPYSGEFTLRHSWADVNMDGSNGHMYGWHPDPSGLVPDSEVEYVSAGWNAHDGDMVSRDSGNYYRTVWNEVLEEPHPQIVLLQSFNDYLEDAALWVTDTSDNASDEEQYSDLDGQLNPSMYWEMTKSFINELRTDRPGSVIVDNDSSGWYSPAPMSYNNLVEPEPMFGASERYTGPGPGEGTGDGAAWSRYTPDLPTSGSYEVYAWWASNTSHATNVPYTCYYNGGNTGAIRVDQSATENGGKWYYLGTYPFSAGTSDNCYISNDGTDGYVMMDAMKFVAIQPGEVTVDNDESGWNTPTGTPSFNSAGAEAQPMYGGSERYAPGVGSTSSATAVGRFTPNLSAGGDYSVYAYWTSKSDRATDAPYTCHYDGGTTEIRVDQNDRDFGGTWFYVGTWNFAAGTSGYCELGNNADGYVMMDAMKWVPS